MSTPAKKTTKPRAKPDHPPTSVMVLAAVKALKERNGSSLPAIKKYIAANYKVDVAKLAPFIKKALKSLTEKGKLTQTKGKGASGSFKLAAAAKAEKKPKAKKPKTPKKKPAAKKPAAEKKAAAAKPKKAKTPKKAPAKKPAAKKPAKKTSPKKKAAPKKK